MEVGGLRIELVRKDIRNLHLGVYPPAGRVRVAVPLAVSDDAVRLAVIGRLGWIRRQQARFQAQPRQSAREDDALDARAAALVELARNQHDY